MKKVLKQFALAMTVLALASATGGRAGAQVILVEPPGTLSGNSWPLSLGEVHWQQGYNDGFFGSAPVTITAFSFRADSSDSVSYGPEFAVRMSTTAKEPGSFSTTFADNFGTDTALVFSGPVTLSAVTGGYVTLSLSVGFNYNPTLGNLLIDITHGNSTSSTSLAVVSYDQRPAGLERVASTGETATSGISFGFGEVVTRFQVTTAAVPEPSQLATAGLGLLLAGGYRLARRRR